MSYWSPDDPMWANALTQRFCDFDELPHLCCVMRKWSEAAHSYKYTSTIRKPSIGEIIAMFRPQNAAANYVKIITMSKSMSSAGLREGSATTHSNTSSHTQTHTHTHTHRCTHRCTHRRTHTHTHTHTHTVYFSSCDVIVSPHAWCVSTQELTAWGAGYKAWEWLHESYLESVSLLQIQDTRRTTHSSTEVYSYTHTYTHTRICMHTDVCQA